MDELRKKELQEEYKNYRPEMGIYSIKHKASGKTYLEAVGNLKGKMNSSVFQLNMECFRLSKTLNEDWKIDGKDAFDLEVLETLEYKKEDDGTMDYTDDLEGLYKLWVQKLKEEGRSLY